MKFSKQVIQIYQVYGFIKIQFILQLAGSAVEPVLETTCFERPSALRDHCSD